MSHSQKTGRHTPLSLNNPGGKNKKKTGSVSTESVTVSTTLTATAQTPPITTEKIVVETTKHKTSQQSQQKQQKNNDETIKSVNQQTSVTHSSQIPKAVKVSTSSAVTDGNSVVEKVKKNENGTSTEEKVSNGDQKTEETNTNNSSTSEEKKIRESLRQKALKEVVVILNKDDDKKKEIENKDLTGDTVENSVQKKVETSLEKSGEVPDIVGTTTPTKQHDTSFSGDEEMEALMMQVEFPGGSSPMPPAQTPGRILKFGTGGPPPTRARISPFRRSDRIQQNASIIVNLSTVSEQSTDTTTATLTTPEPIIREAPQKSFSAGLRSISGRKSMRPLREMTFQNSYRETYRKLNESTTSSMNATVGSDIHNDSVRSPMFSMLARKRERVETDDHHKIQQIHETDLSPKRQRLDLSGFLGIVASPVTMLRRKLQGTKLQSSTPNKGRTEEDITIDTVSASDIDIETIEDNTDFLTDEQKNNTVDKGNDFLKDHPTILATSELPIKRKWCAIM